MHPPVGISQLRLLLPETVLPFGQVPLMANRQSHFNLSGASAVSMMDKFVWMVQPAGLLLAVVLDAYSIELISQVFSSVPHIRL